MQAGQDLTWQTFYIVNKKYNQSRVGMWDQHGYKIGTSGGEYSPNQLWQLRGNQPGQYLIENCYFRFCWIAKLGKEDYEVGVEYTEEMRDNQLWKFEKQQDGFYYIYNKQYPDARLAKWDPEDMGLQTYSGEKHEDQLWKLVPRFEASLTFKVIWEADNRQGTQPFSEKVMVTQGFKGLAHFIKVKVGVQESINATTQAGLEAIGQESTEIGNQFINSLNTMMSENAYGEELESEVTFSAPPGKHIKVLRLTGEYADHLGDSFGFQGFSFKTDEID